jgi:hypothetical protein
MTTISDKKQRTAQTSNTDAPAGKADRAVGKVAERQLYAAWLYDPNRVPRTQKEFARQIGVSEATLSDWKKTSPEVLAAAKAIKESPAIRVGFAEATRRMAEEAKGGKVNAYRALADVLGELAPSKIEMGGSLADFLRGTAKPEAVRPYATTPNPLAPRTPITN